MKVALLILVVVMVCVPMKVQAEEVSSVVDTDGDGYSDEQELFSGFDPKNPEPVELPKTIKVSLKEQRLRYYTGDYLIKEVKVSTGLAKYSTPRGVFTIDKKMPSHLYAGQGYYYPNTKWNMRFKPHPKGSYYIHGAYWHNSFGKPRSHGCVNVAYKDVEALYNWAPVGTPVIIE